MHNALSQHKTVTKHKLKKSSTLHLNINFLPVIRIPPHILQQVTPLEILIRMNDRLKLVRAPCALVAHLFDFLLVGVVEYPGRETYD